jgi:hypothetical protein
MQSDDDIGRVRAEAPIVLCLLFRTRDVLWPAVGLTFAAFALEQFIKQLVENSTKIALAEGAKTLQPLHMFECVFDCGSVCQERKPSIPSPSLTFSSLLRQLCPRKRRRRSEVLLLFVMLGVSLKGFGLPSLWSSFGCVSN